MIGYLASNSRDPEAVLEDDRIWTSEDPRLATLLNARYGADSLPGCDPPNGLVTLAAEAFGWKGVVIPKQAPKHPTGHWVY